MSSAADREREIRQRLKDDFSHYAPRCLKLRTKAGEILPFRLNRTQAYLHERLETQRRETGRVRALVLKGRQIGISTYVAGRFYWRVTHRSGCRAFILAHHDDASSNLFELAQRFHEHCPPLVRPSTGASNAKELSFDRLDSGYRVATAGTKAVGRSQTIQMFHGSEMAFWPNAQEHVAGIEQAIADAPDTEDIRESTANGVGGAFHAVWQAAERGDSQFEPIFLPWHWHEEYVRPPPDGWAPPDTRPEEGDLSWRDYERVHALERPQTYWAWCKSRDLASVTGGSPEHICWKFQQEYPATAAEAFQTSGGASFVPAGDVVRARHASAVGYGPIILGVDPARGGGDKTGMIDRQGRRAGAHICKRIDSSDLMATAGEVARVAKAIGARKVVIDTTGLGAGLYDRLRETMGHDMVAPVNFGSRALRPEHYVNRRAEIWDEMRQWLLDPASVQIPNDDALHKDICAPQRGAGQTRFNSSGQLILEGKDEIKKRLGASPDLGDALALTFAVSIAPARDWGFATTSHGGQEAWLGA